MSELPQVSEKKTLFELVAKWGLFVPVALATCLSIVFGLFVMSTFEEGDEFFLPWIFYVVAICVNVLLFGVPCGVGIALIAYGRQEK